MDLQRHRNFESFHNLKIEGNFNKGKFEFPAIFGQLEQNRKSAENLHYGNPCSDFKAQIM